MKFTQAIRSKDGLLRKIWAEEFRVEEEFVWYIDFETKNSRIIIPAWFVTNFWSIPRILRVFFNPIKFLWYILHDWLYTKNIYIQYDENGTTISVIPTRKQADEILREAIKVEWGWKIERNMIYLWVRIWGFNHYER